MTKKMLSCFIVSSVFVGLTMLSSSGCSECKSVSLNQGDATTMSQTQKILTPEEAIKIAIRHAGFTSTADVIMEKCELDREWNGLVYEIEFSKNRHEYEYDIDAKTGRIIKAKKELDD